MRDVQALELAALAKDAGFDLGALSRLEHPLNRG
jgi:hypothetical protein